MEILVQKAPRDRDRATQKKDFKRRNKRNPRFSFDRTTTSTNTEAAFVLVFFCLGILFILEKQLSELFCNLVKWVYLGLFFLLHLNSDNSPFTNTEHSLHTKPVTRWLQLLRNHILFPSPAQDAPASPPHFPQQLLTTNTFPKPQLEAPTVTEQSKWPRKVSSRAAGLPPSTEG